MNQDSPGVLLAAVNQTSLESYLLLARAMAEDGRLRPILGYSFPEAEPRARQASQGRFELAPLYDAAAPAGSSLAARARDRLLPPFWALTLAQRRQLQAEARFCARVLDRLAPRALILSDDRKLRPGLNLLRAAGSRGLCTVLAPFAQLAGMTDQLLLRQEAYDHLVESPPWAGVKRRLARRHPRQVEPGPQGALFFYSAPATLALEGLGLLPDHPWRFGRSSDASIAVTGFDEKERLQAQGVAPERIVVVGDPSHDQLHALARDCQGLRARLIRRYQLDPDREIIILAAPSLAEQGVLDRKTQERDLEAMVQALGATGDNLLISLHPKSDPAAYASLEQRHPARLLAEPLRQALPAARLLAGGYTTTMLWAVLLGIPGLILDFHSHDYPYFQRFAGILRAFSPSEMRRLLREELSDPARRQELAGLQLEAARQLTPFDGQATQRMIQLILQGLARQGQGARPAPPARSMADNP